MKPETGLLGETAGTGKVFRFTLKETFKMKANIISLVLILLMSLFSVPLGSLMLGDSSYDAMDDSYYEEEYDREETQTDNYGSLTQSQLDYLKTQGVSDVVINALKRYGTGCEWDSVEEYEEYIEYMSDEYEETGDTEEDNGMDTMMLQLIYAIFVMMLCIVATSYIIRSVLEEKTSKLVDLLMVSVKPLALLLGKILAMLAYVLVMLLILIAGALVSHAVFQNVVDTSFLSVLMPAGVSFGFWLLKTILVMIISAITGYIGFGFLAGVLGAGCTSMDDASGAMGVPTILIMAGYGISVATSSIQSGGLQTVLSLIPVLGMYVAPVQFSSGKIGIVVLLLSWLVQLLWAVLGLWTASRVYAHLIINNGRKMKLGEILKMAVKGVA